MKNIKKINNQAWFDMANEMIKKCGEWKNTKGMSEEKIKELLEIAKKEITRKE